MKRKIAMVATLGVVGTITAAGQIPSETTARLMAARLSFDSGTMSVRQSFSVVKVREWA